MTASQIIFGVIIAGIVLGVLVALTTITVQMIKNIGVLENTPTKFVAMVVSILYCSFITLIAIGIVNVSMSWYYILCAILAAIIIGIVISYISTYGWDTFNSLLKENLSGGSSVASTVTSAITNITNTTSVTTAEDTTDTSSTDTTSTAKTTA